MTTPDIQFENSYLTLPHELYTVNNPTSFPNPELVIANDNLATEIGLNIANLDKKDRALFFSGNLLPTHAKPFSQSYAGHQYGHFTILGDGRAHVLGEHITPNNTRLDLQLKGSGRTPYSRRGDGRAALGPMLREYLISEAMHNLGIPTTRSLAVVTTGESIMRETPLPGAILTRIASSHIRFGTFEFAAAQGDLSLTKSLLNYSIQRHYPQIDHRQNIALEFLSHLIERQSDLIVHWMRVGFVHGVMNTDNMIISGETIDYGPCAFMDEYDPGTVFSSIDSTGRYAFINQPAIAQWNIARLAETILPFIENDTDKAIKTTEKIISQFSIIFNKKWLEMMKKKLGLFGEQPNDAQLISDLLDWMHKSHADYTNTFRDLSDNNLNNKIYQDNDFQNWLQLWQDRRLKNKVPLQQSVNLMKKNNPNIIPRNHHVERALKSAELGDLQPFHQLLKALKEPYNKDKSQQPYQSPPKPNERIYQTFCGT